MKRRITAVAAVLAAVGALAAGCGGGSGGGGGGGGGNGGGSSGEPIKVGMALGLSGYLAEFDGNVKRGADLAVKELNAHGGILGRHVQLDIQDMKSDPQQGVQATQKLISSGGVDALVNGFSSAATAAEAPIIARAKVPALVASVLPSPAPPFVFSTIPPATYETGVRIDYLKQQNVKSVGVLYDVTPYAAVQLDAAKQQLQKAGIKLLGTEKHATDATDLRSQVNSLLSKHPEAILKLGAGPTNVVAAKNMSALGAHIPILMSIDDISIFKQASDAYDDVLFAAAPAQVYDDLSPAERPKALTEFIKRFREANLTGDPTYPGRAWDAVFLVAKAMQTAGSTDGEKVSKALESMGPFAATTGTYDFTAASHYGITSNPMYLAKLDNGNVKIVFKPSGQ